MKEEIKRFAIKENERQSWFSLAMIWTGAMVCIPCLMIGGLLSSGLTLPNIILSIVIGYGIVIFYMCFMGMEACDTGLPTVTLAASALGKKGSKYIISILLAVACIGWFGIQSSVCGNSFSSMISTISGLNIPVWLSSTIWGIIMLLTAVFGYNSMKYLNFVAVPLLVGILIYSTYATFTKFNAIDAINKFTPPNPISLVSGISLVVATFALGGVISGDYSRYAKNRKDVIKSGVFGVLPSGLVIILLGATMSISTGKYDISAVLSDLGIPVIGLIALILATWTTNVTNAYSGGLAVSDLFGASENKRGFMTAIAGIIGTLLAAFGFMNYFTNFLSVLTAFIPPVAGVMITSYWIVGKGKKENFIVDKDFNYNGIISFIIGAIAAYFTGSIYPIFIGPINGILLSMICYVVLEKTVFKEDKKIEIKR